MKKISIYLIFGMVIALSYSCIDDFRFGDKALDKPAGTDLTIDSIFSRADLARDELWTLYWYTPTPAPTFQGVVEMNCDWAEGLSDCIHSILSWGYLNSFWYDGSFGPTTEWGNRWVYGTYSRTWEGIRIALTFLENIDRVPDMSKEEKARLKAEAKVILAGKYYEFFRHYGGIPIMTKAMTSEDDTHCERGTIEEMYNYMIGLLDEAIAEPNLPWVLPTTETNEWWGRITKAAALGQKMLVQLYAASPLFNSAESYYTADQNNEAVQKHYVWWGKYKPELWTELRKTCEQFIAMNTAPGVGEPYRLIQPETRNEAGYRAAFRNAYFNRADWHNPSSQKGVYEIVYGHLDRAMLGYSWWDAMFAFSSYQGAWGQQNPTAEFMEKFCWADGRVFDPNDGCYANVERPTLSANVKEPYDVPDVVKNRPPRADDYYIFDNRDPRLYETLRVQKKGEVYNTTPQIEIWPKGNAIQAFPDGFAHGISNFKWVLNYPTQDVRDRQYCWPIFRMGAFHLIYAEALAETGDLQGACNQINIVRARVGLPAIETSNPQLNLTTNKDNLIKQILRERACELGYEDTRFSDMVRRKLKDDFVKPLNGVWTYRMDGKQGSLESGEPYPHFWYVKTRIFRLKQRKMWEPGGWNDRFYLTCFPQDEVNKGYGLVQNPGW